MTVIWTWLGIAYGVISFLVGVFDLARAAAQEKYLSTFPIGDIGENVVPKQIYGIHNWIFLPSWAVIILWLYIVR